MHLSDDCDHSLRVKLLFLYQISLCPASRRINIFFREKFRSVKYIKTLWSAMDRYGKFKYFTLSMTEIVEKHREVMKGDTGCFFGDSVINPNEIYVA